ncbi:MAG TPA: TetR/AcrR family transcriptional regulator [Caulobacteraceae bacterium]|nr:TetR/AcrR family transcriptional regulator [Caulobacteraceae bacterium]
MAGSKSAWGDTLQKPDEQFELKRGAILTTAAQIIRRRGYSQTSLADIAEVLGVSKPTIYYYFRNKDQIILELLRATVETILDPDDHPEDYPNAPGLNGAERFERYLRRIVRLVSDDMLGCLLTTPREMLNPATRHEYDVCAPVVERMAEGIIQDGIDDGSIAPCDPRATHLFVVGALSFLPNWRYPEAYPAGALADLFVDFAMQGMRPRQG